MRTLNRQLHLWGFPGQLQYTNHTHNHRSVGCYLPSIICLLFFEWREASNWDNVKPSISLVEK